MVSDVTAASTACEVTFDSPNRFTCTSLLNDTDRPLLLLLLLALFSFPSFTCSFSFVSVSFSITVSLALVSVSWTVSTSVLSGGGGGSPVGRASCCGARIGAERVLRGVRGLRERGGHGDRASCNRAQILAPSLKMSLSSTHWWTLLYL